MEDAFIALRDKEVTSPVKRSVERGFSKQFSHQQSDKSGETAVVVSKTDKEKVLYCISIV